VKHIVLFLLFTLFLMGCMNLYQPPLPDFEINSVEDAMAICKDITPAYDPVFLNLDFWKAPEETYYLGEGDCEDVGILFLYLCREYLDMDNLVLGKCYVPWGTAGHAIVIDYESGTIYDVFSELPICDVNDTRYDIVGFLEYDEVMANLGAKVNSF